MLGVSNLYLCVLSFSFTINGELVGEIPSEELHFNESVLYILDIIDVYPGSSRCLDSEASQNIALKINFRFS